MSEKRKVGGSPVSEIPPPTPRQPMTWGELKALVTTTGAVDSDVVLLSDSEGNNLMAVHAAIRETDEAGPYLWLRGSH